MSMIELCVDVTCTPVTMCCVIRYSPLSSCPNCSRTVRLKTCNLNYRRVKIAYYGIARLYDFDNVRWQKVDHVGVAVIRICLLDGLCLDIDCAVSLLILSYIPIPIQKLVDPPIPTSLLNFWLWHF